MTNVYKVRVLTNCNVCKNLCIIINWYDPITVILSSWGRPLPSLLTMPATGQSVCLWTWHKSHLLQQALWFLRFLKHKVHCKTRYASTLKLIDATQMFFNFLGSIIGLIRMISLLSPVFAIPFWIYIRCKHITYFLCNIIKKHKCN